MHTFKFSRILTLSIFVFSFISTALTNPPEGYLLEVVSEYETGDQGIPYELVIDPEGTIYVSHWESSITRIENGSVKTRWINSISKPRSMVWTGGSEFGNNLCVVDADLRRVIKLDSSGKLTPLTGRINQGPSFMDLDRNGFSGGDLFVASRGTDGIQRIKPDGSVTEFYKWPNLIPGGIIEITISPTTRYNGNMFVVVDDTEDDINDGLYQIDGDATVVRFAKSLHFVYDAKFDLYNKMFENDLFAIALKEGVDGMHLWRVNEDGTSEAIMRVGWGVVRQIAFGPDGAMYLIKHTPPKTQILRFAKIPPLSIDIKPGNCFNILGRDGDRWVSVAIVGENDFDVSKIDVATIKLQGVSPSRSNYADVSSPETEDHNCRMPDGIKDLTLKFDQRKLLKAARKIKNSRKQNTVSLTLRCMLMDNDSKLKGTDIIRLKSNPQKNKKN